VGRTYDDPTILVASGLWVKRGRCGSGGPASLKLENRLRGFPHGLDCARGETSKSRAAGRGVPATAARVLLSRDRGVKDCRGTTDTAFHFDCVRRAVEFAGAALHAPFRLGQMSFAAVLGEDAVGAHNGTHPAPVAERGVVAEGVDCIGARHSGPPSAATIAKTAPAASPPPNIHAISGA
jgi:hypothetical protein